MHGDGAGGLTLKGTFAAGPQAAVPAVADLDNDGWLDVTVANWLGASIGILRGAGGGVLRPQQAFAVGGATRSYSLADFDQDGKLDVAVVVDQVKTLTVLWNVSK